MNNRKKNQLAPDFSLEDQHGKQHSLSDYRGQWVIIYFYPQDDTPGCTLQACDIRDSWQEFAKRGVVVFGISPDKVESHQQFAAKYQLPFTLLADPDKTVIHLYEAWQEKVSFGILFFGVERCTFIVSPQGYIAKVLNKVNPKTHVTKVLKVVEELQNAVQV